MKKKQQQSMTTFFSKKPRVEESPDPQQSPAPAPQAQPLPPLEVGESSKSISSTEVPQLPDCWKLQQYRQFKDKYDGMVVSNKKLGCEYCAKPLFSLEKGIHVSKEWKHFQVVPAGKKKETQQASLRKKLKQHFQSKAHLICVETSTQCEQDAFTKSIDKSTDRYLASTCTIFSTAYDLAQRCKPFSDIEAQVNLLQTIGKDVGVGLHSRRSAVKIIEFIANDIKTTVFSEIIAKDLKVCLIIDEASTISIKAVLIVFVRVEHPAYPTNIFVELLELEKQDAETIFSAAMESLHRVGFTTEYLQKNLIAFCSDGANVMLGRKSGVSVRIARDFPNIVIWHCLNHRLQLVLDDAIREIKQVNHFKIFLDRIYSIFQRSVTTRNQLFQISKQLGNDVVKIGRVLGPRWAACSLRTTIAVWRDYPALHQFFLGNESFPGMASRFENLNFLKDLVLMIDILSEISLLSNTLSICKDFVTNGSVPLIVWKQAF